MRQWAHNDCMRGRQHLAVVLLTVGVLSACRGGPTAPAGGPLAAGRWSGDNACLSVAVNGCDLVVGCGHGRFPQPTLRADGTFEVDGSYRLEAGPISIDPPPPAHFAGAVTGTRLHLTMTPQTQAAMSFFLSSTNDGKCPVLCL
jgi:hypothetical protein